MLSDLFFLSRLRSSTFFCIACYPFNQAWRPSDLFTAGDLSIFVQIIQPWLVANHRYALFYAPRVFFVPRQLQIVVALQVHPETCRVPKKLRQQICCFSGYFSISLNDFSYPCARDPDSFGQVSWLYTQRDHKLFAQNNAWVLQWNTRSCAVTSHNLVSYFVNRFVSMYSPAFLCGG